MKASELIQELERLIKIHGDFPVYVDLDWTEMPVGQIEYHEMPHQGLEVVQGQEERFVI